MRGCVAATVAVLVLVVGGPAWADRFEADGDREADGIQYSGEVGGTSAGAQSRADASAARARPRRRHSSVPAGYRAWSPRVNADCAAPCLTYETETFPDEASAVEENAQQDQRWQNLTRQYDFCPGVTPPPGRAAQPSAASLAQTFWGEIPLPGPEPRIAPGYALCGKRAFLETGGSLSEPFTRETPLGTLTLETKGAFTVDWGDGTTDGPFDFAGEPWPNGRISHVYQYKGTVTVRVTEAWTATWRLGGQSGDLSSLRTDATIENFEIRELQAVRNR